MSLGCISSVIPQLWWKIQGDCTRLSLVQVMALDLSPQLWYNWRYTTKRQINYDISITYFVKIFTWFKSSNFSPFLVRMYRGYLNRLVNHVCSKLLLRFTNHVYLDRYFKVMFDYNESKTSFQNRFLKSSHWNQTLKLKPDLKTCLRYYTKGTTKVKI